MFLTVLSEQILKCLIKITFLLTLVLAFLPAYFKLCKHLHTNMRVHLHGDEAAGEFTGQLLAIGDGKYPIDTSSDLIHLPETIGTFVCNIEELVSKVYPDLLSNFRNMTWLSER